MGDGGGKVKVLVSHWIVPGLNISLIVAIFLESEAKLACFFACFIVAAWTKKKLPGETYLTRFGQV